MRVKRYVADSIQEAITRVKNDLGRNAIILHTKPFKEGGFLGFFYKRRFEVIAAVDENISDNFLKKGDGRNIVPSPPVGVRNTAMETQESPAPFVPVPTQVPAQSQVPVPNQTPVYNPNFPAPVISDQNPAAQVFPAKPAVLLNPEPAPVASNPASGAGQTGPNLKEASATAEPGWKSLRDEIAEVKELILQVATKPAADPPPPVPPVAPISQIERSSSLESFKKCLHLLGMEGEIIDYLVLQIPSYLVNNSNTSVEELLNYCQQVLATKLMFSEPIQTESSGEQQIVALIGPTGVGKTTTIAKLAANFNLFEGKKVGLITIDTYRIAAVEHLKTYGDIINLPVEVVYTPSDLGQSFQNLRDCDLILIDTAGRSPQNQAMMDELKKFLSHSKIGIILLVISATTKYQDMVVIAENFSRIAFTHLVFTKLDETSCLGPIISLAWMIKRPISYLTTGQNVPDDIEVARSEKLIAQLFKGLSHG